MSQPLVPGASRTSDDNDDIGSDEYVHITKDRISPPNSSPSDVANLHASGAGGTHDRNRTRNEDQYEDGYLTAPLNAEDDARRGLLSNASREQLELDEDEDEDGIGVGDDTGLVIGGASRRVKEESAWSFVRTMIIETTPALAFNTIGLTITGQLLETVSHWRAMTTIDELFILIPVITNMKGNLEMNLSSRLSTAAFLGHLDHIRPRQAITIGNLLLLQIQAVLVSSLAGCFSFVLELLLESFGGGNVTVISSPSEAVRRRRRRWERWRWNEKRAGAHRPKPPPVRTVRPGIFEFLMVVATAMTSGALSALTLGSFMCTLVLLCRRYNFNPDNVTPPVASALGDLITLSILSLISTLFLPFLRTLLPLLIIFGLIFVALFSAYRVRVNPYVRALLSRGWTPLVGAMIITSGSGLVLDSYVEKFKGFGLLATVITGVSGGVGSVFVSRISTSLHAAQERLSGSEKEPRLLLQAATLFGISFPIQLLFLTFLHVSGWMMLPFTFVCIFMVAFSFATCISLILANSLTHYLWSKDLDPDMYAMPIQSSLVDLLGQCLLLATYELASSLGDKDRLVLPPPVAPP